MKQDNLRGAAYRAPQPAAQAHQGNSQVAWLAPATVVAAGLLGFFLWRGNWRGARIAGGFAAALAEKRGEIRLRRRVMALLARQERMPDGTGGEAV